MKTIKSFLYQTFLYTLHIIMKVPIHCFRDVFLNCFLGSRGHNVEICRSVEFTNPRNISIGSYCTVNKDVLLDGRGGKIIIGDCVDIAQEVNIWTLEHDYNSPSYEARGKDVQIDRYAWLASRVTILPGVHIGEGAVIASGAVVTKDVPPYTVVGGIPAKRIGERSRHLDYKLGNKRFYH